MTDLKAKLSEMISEERINERDRDNTSQYATGFEFAVEELNKWMDTQSDGWHDLIENPDDTPPRDTTVWVCTNEYVIQGVYRDEWEYTKYNTPIGQRIMAWRNIVVPEMPEIPACFKEVADG